MNLKAETRQNRGLRRWHQWIIGTFLVFVITGNALAYLDPPALLSPANRDTTQPTTPQLRWSAVVFAHSYEIQTAVDSTFSFIRLDTLASAIPSPSIVVGPFGYDSTYYWRVRTRDSTGSYGIWSTSWRFRTIRPTPAVPTLVAPANNTTNLLLSDSLVWNAVAFADAYGVQISTSSAFTTIAVDTVVPMVSGNSKLVLPLPPLNNKTPYYWRVNSRNGAGASAWSSGWKFTTIVAIPSIPVLSSPAEAAKSLPTNPTLSWGAVTDAASYRLQISPDSLFSTTVYDDSSITTASKQVTGLGYTTLFFCRVRARNLAGIGQFSAVRRFSTQLPQPILVWPTNALTGVPLEPTLDWGSLAGAVLYRVQMSTATSFTPLLLNTTTTDALLPVGPLLNNTRYYWRVSAVGSAGDTSTYPTTAWNFTTIVDTATVPVLLTPLDNAGSLPTNPTLSWADTGGTSFTLQISTDPGFSTLAYNDSTLTAKSKQVTGLNFNTTYYWRVSTKNAAARTPYSGVRRFSTQLAQPSIVSPPNNGTGLGINAVLDWQPVAGAVSYRLQVSTNTTFSPALVNTTTPSDQHALVLLSNGTKYYWRVSALNAGSDTSAYPTTAWNFTTIVDTPAVPVLLTPADAAKSAPLGVTFTWESSGGTSYRLQVASDTNFSSLVFNDSTITSKSKAVSGLLSGTRYYWRVNAKNVSATSEFSTTRSFTTQLPLVQVSSPLSGAADQSVNVQLTWLPVNGAVSYTVQISPTQSPFSPTILHATTAAEYVVASGLQYNTRYYWRVSARNANGDSSLYPATPWNFKSKIPAPLLGSPASGASGQPINPTLVWNVSAGANLYRLQVSIDPTFQAGGLLDDSTISSSVTVRQIGPLDNSRTYYWRVRAKDIVSPSLSDWSTVWGFTTKIDTPAVPTLLSPANLSTALPANTILVWTPSAGASLYSVQVAYDSLFTQRVVDGPPVIGTTLPVGPLLNNTRYFWRAKAINSAGTASSHYSAPWAFTTIIALPGIPSTVSPPSGAANQPEFVTLKWRKANSASTYQLDVTTDSRFEGTPAVDSTGIVDTAVTVGPLVNNTYYYWRVSSVNALGTSAPSPVSSFSTVIAPPVLIFPANNATNLNAPVTFQWNAVAGASSYRLQIALEPAFASIVVDDSLIAGTSRSVSSLGVSKRYYWRVMTVNSTNGVAVSPVWNFTTTIYQPDTPALVFPSHNATGQPVQITLRWSKALGANSYRLQVATTPTFASGMVFDTPGLADTVRRLTTLQHNSLYYWRVMAFNDIGPSEYSPVWSFTTAVPPPAVPILALPLNGETGVLQPATLVWRRAAGATSYTLKVFLVNRSVVEFRPNLTDTSAMLSSLAPGIQYHWRVIAVNTGGVDSSAEWGFTTIIDPPTSPVPVSPADGSVNQPTTLALEWRSSPGATQYRLQISSDPGFSTIVYNDSSITDTARVVGPLPGLTGYYWHVQARNTSGNSPLSPSWMFTTTMSTPAALLPADGAQHQPIALSLRWSTVIGGSSYRVQVAHDSLFQTRVYDDSLLVGDSVRVSGLSNSTRYFWRVRAKSASGLAVSAFAPPWSFTTIVDTPAVPALAAPVDRASGISTTTMLRWRSIPRATRYTLAVSTDSLFGTILLRDSLLTDTLRQVGPLTTLTRYWWRVSAANIAGTSPASLAWSFFTVVASPVLVTPADSSRMQPTTLVLAWQPSPGATSYRLQVSSDSLYSTTFIDDSTITSSSKQVAGLSVYTTYYWRVRAKNQAGTGEYSGQWRFTTIVIPPAATPLATPANGAAVEPVLAMLRWRRVPLAEKYVVQLSLDSPFDNPVFEDSTGTDTLLQVGPLQYLTRYFWRVRAKNIQGEGPSSAIWAFTTIVEAPTTPAPLSPKSASRDQLFFVRLVWSASARADRYHVQVAGDAAFDSLVVNDTTVVDTSHQVGPLDHSRTYFWRVRALNAGWSTPFTATWSFTTLEPPTEYSLSQNYPNPFNPVTKITYQLPQETDVTLKLYNMLGQEVGTIVNSHQKPGRYEVELDAGGLPSGVYMYRLRTSEWSSVRKLMVVR